MKRRVARAAVVVRASADQLPQTRGCVVDDDGSKGRERAGIGEGEVRLTHPVGSRAEVDAIVPLNGQHRGDDRILRSRGAASPATSDCRGDLEEDETERRGEQPQRLDGEDAHVSRATASSRCDAGFYPDSFR
ncbi:hypothetical protein CSUB01_06359 [Colletotrichum sublineola]|uniref:Uncharacterized protein n=1 Tax=Colletotrichum sublineola TaxID=1173701 RepID=A0A066WT68_COLSU|nr:hypothetical protein CSUB01_06359 [Colletotrichum sublineola]